MKHVKNLLLLMLSMVMFMGSSFASVSVIKKDKPEYHQGSVESIVVGVSSLSVNDEFGLSVSKGDYKEATITKSVTTHLRKYNSFDDYLRSLGYLDYKNTNEPILENKELGSGINFITEITFDC